MARATVQKYSAALEGMVVSLELYAQAYEAEFKSTLSEDYVLGEAWKEMADGFLQLLNGPLGNHDGGTLDRRIRGIVKNAGFSDE